LDWFESLGYATLQGPDIAPGEPAAERSDFSHVVLTRRLRDALARLNPLIPEPALEETFRQVLRADTRSLTENNRRFRKMLTDGVDVEYRRPAGVQEERQVHCRRALSGGLKPRRIVLSKLLRDLLCINARPDRKGNTNDVICRSSGSRAAAFRKASMEMVDRGEMSFPTPVLRRHIPLRKTVSHPAT
jgi:hypothetical protein